MTLRAAVALGSNLGDRLEILQRAVRSLGSVGQVAAVSSLYETAPVGGPDQGSYLNAVVLLDTDLAPLSLMRELLNLESAAGRVRVERWGPRTLDLDLIVAEIDGEPVVSDQREVILPHPRAHERRFVLDPLVEVWENAPIGGSTAREILESLGDQHVDRLASDWVEAGPSWVSAALVVAQFLLLAVFGGVVVFTSDGVDVVGGLAGGAVLVGGAVLGMWASASLGAALTPFPEPKPGTALVDRGPYRHVRHPIYTSVLLVLVGAALIAGSVPGLLSIPVLTAFFWSKAGYEESRLRLLVPGYAAYARRVRGRLLPRFRAAYARQGVRMQRENPDTPPPDRGKTG